MKDQNKNKLGHYLTLNRILRFKSVKHKFFAITFVATHIPLISFVSYLFIQKSFTASVTEWMILLVATLVGTLFAFWSIQQLLKPVNCSIDALDKYLSTQELSILPHQINDEMGQLMRSISYTLDTLDRRFKELENVSSYDFLTDLHNRRSAKTKLNSVLKPTHNKSMNTFIIMIDLDDFKRVNDQYGHFAGDVILQDLATEIKSSFVLTDDWAARWGGDEFMLVLHGHQQAVVNQLQSLKKIITNKQLPFENKSLIYSVSIGMAAYTADKSLLETIKEADNALFQAKNKGKNQLHIA